jgi:hypothetical protein
MDEQEILELLPYLPSKHKKKGMSLFNAKDWEGLYLLVTSITDKVDAHSTDGPKGNPKLYDLTAKLLLLLADKEVKLPDDEEFI